MQWLLIFFLILLIVSMLSTIWPVLILIAALFLVWKIYISIYFKSKRFLSIKSRIQSYIDDCNELNRHIEELKDTPLEANKLDSGVSYYHDKSRWNVKRPELKKQKYAPNIHNCSRTVCDSARKEPFKYVCKYFHISADEETLEKFESLLNNLEAAEDGKVALQKERESILLSIEKDIPALIRTFCKKKIERELGFDIIDFSTEHFPKYVFQYISPGGNTSIQCDIVMDITNLNKFVSYLSEKIKFRKSVAGQRALMTSKLRQKIKARDGFACKQCGASVAQEPNLLLEIDHIIPVSRGGLTTEDNLQTLCWRCNRSKGARVT